MNVPSKIRKHTDPEYLVKNRVLVILHLHIPENGNSAFIT